MRKAVQVVALMLAGCGSSGTPAAPAGPTPPAFSGPPGAADVDPNVIYGSKTTYCYEDTETNLDGACADALGACKELRAKTIEFWFVELTTSLMKSAKAEGKEFDSERTKTSVLNGEAKRWSACTERRFFACVFAVDVVSGAPFRACAPTMRACQRLLSDAKSNPDIALNRDSCVIYRVRE